jgi:general secretion pathway protein B
MSFILDALRKLEQKRQKESAPRILGLQNSVPPGSSRRPHWPYLLAVGLLLNATVFGWWIASSKHGGPAEPPVVAEKSAPADETPVARNSPQSIDPAGPNGREHEVETAASREQASAAAPVTVVRKKASPESVDAPVSEPQKEAAVLSQPPKRIIAMDELPDSVRKDLPDLAVSLHVYTKDPSTRLARVNNRTVREGDFAAPGLRVEEITPDGVVLRFQGYRFRTGNF